MRRRGSQNLEELAEEQVLAENLELREKVGKMRSARGVSGEPT